MITAMMVQLEGLPDVWKIVELDTTDVRLMEVDDQSVARYGLHVVGEFSMSVEQIQTMAGLQEADNDPA